MTISTDDVIAKVTASAFGQPLVTNVMRGHVVEAMIALALEPEWRWCSGDYAAWDFERADGLRMEVRQSAYQQSWVHAPHVKISRRFDIEPREYAWEGAYRKELTGRAAHVYVFAYHDVRDGTADQRDPGQWAFYVVPTTTLPDQKSIALNKLQMLTSPTGLEGLLEITRRLLPLSASGRQNVGEHAASLLR